MSNNQLQLLLDGYTYLEDENGHTYTPRESFEDIYNQLISDSEAYFKDLLDDTDKDAVLSEKKIFNDDGAIAIIQHYLNLLDGGTVERK